MTRPYRWVGGIGYLLSFIPYVGIVSSLVAAVAWILMGQDTREKIFTITGILMIVTFVVGASTLLLLFMMLPMGIMGMMGGEVPFRPFRGLGQLMVFLVVVLIAAIIAFASLVLEIISHLRAGKIFNSTWFKLAGWLRVATIIVVVVSVPLLIFQITKNLATVATTLPDLAQGFALFTLLASLLWPIMLVVVLGLLSVIFSIVAFFTMPEARTPT